jgi:hypothetical protein
MVEASTSNGERRVVLQPIAVKKDGTRVPAVERQCERYLTAPAAMPTFSADDRLELFNKAVEPTLQRELKHKGARQWRRQLLSRAGGVCGGCGVAQGVN